MAFGLNSIEQLPKVGTARLVRFIELQFRSKFSPGLRIRQQGESLLLGIDEPHDKGISKPVNPLSSMTGIRPQGMMRLPL